MAQPPQKPGLPRVGGSPIRESESIKEKHANERLEEICGELEEELEELKVKHEMYFLGIERMEPARRREELKRNIARLKNAFTRNAGLRFRIQAIHARYLAYERLWLRSSREKEEGTYRRDILKARRRRSLGSNQQQEETKRRALESEDVDLSDFGPERVGEPAESASPGPESPPPKLEAAESPPAPRPVEAKEEGKPRAEADGPFAEPRALPEAQMRALYDAYVEAKKRCNEDVSKITFESMAKSVNRQIPEIVTRYKAKDVEFKVVIKDGKAILKAVPRI